MEDKIEIMLDFLIRFNDGTITEDQYAAFKKLINDDPQMLECYVETAALFSQFHRNEFKPELQNQQEELNFDSDLWKQLAESEKTAPHKDIEVLLPEKELIQKIDKTKITLQFRKSSILWLSTAAAIIVTIFLFDLLAPSRRVVEVATLSDALGAVWDGDQDTFIKQARLSTRNRSYSLEKGYAELTFDNNAKVTIESPSEFRLLSDDQIELKSGRLYAVIPHEAIGFSVKTENAKIIDLGTEFGVYAQNGGQAEFHVTKGKTNLEAGPSSSIKKQIITEGYAKKVLSNDTVTNIPCTGEQFVQRIDSQRNLVWNGQLTLDIADMVSAGNGLSRGKQGVFLNPANGRFEEMNTSETQQSNTGSGTQIKYGVGQYIPVPNHDFIDGIFVPDSKNAQIQVTSQGHFMTDFGSANGQYAEGFINSSFYRNGHRYELQLNGKPFEFGTNPCLYMQGNLGITFDLNKIRQTFSNLNLKGFKAMCCNQDSGLLMEDSDNASSDILILINGSEKTHRIENIKPGQNIPVEIPLQKDDQFLTLIVTSNNNIKAARTFFGNPEFVMTVK